MKRLALITAAGIGKRIGGKVPKQFILLDERPILAITIDVFQKCPFIDHIIVTVPKGAVGYCKKEIVERYGFSKVYKVVEGGERRQDSVRIGLECAKEILSESDLVLIHDGVRPFIEERTIERMIKEAERYPAVILGIPSKDTVKEVDENGMVIRTYERKRIRLIQTPQLFRFRDIYLAHKKAYTEMWKSITDDSMLLERIGVPVKVIEGSEMNIKITTPFDLEISRIIKKGGISYGRSS